MESQELRDGHYMHLPADLMDRRFGRDWPRSKGRLGIRGKLNWLMKHAWKAGERSFGGSPCTPFSPEAPGIWKSEATIIRPGRGLSTTSAVSDRAAGAVVHYRQI